MRIQEAHPEPLLTGPLRRFKESDLAVRDALVCPSIFLLVALPYQNEEVLKKCAQEYLSRVKKEEQRYQALKVHAEEKLDR